MSSPLLPSPPSAPPLLLLPRMPISTTPPHNQPLLSSARLSPVCSNSPVIAEDAELNYSSSPHLTLLAHYLSLPPSPRGQTAHHLFGIPIAEDSVSVHSSISIFSLHADLIRHAGLLIWDELLMMNKAGWEAADQLRHSISRRPHPLFQSKPIVGLGDFRQLAPVVGEEEKQPPYEPPSNLLLYGMTFASFN
ncbi:hypothetical protein BU15DRAFT_76799 [Melanogaster broomeanus]|nr:hypothetical protein BU15DRAFT_76799 [Melanogaster broomeanus]